MNREVLVGEEWLMELAVSDPEVDESEPVSDEAEGIRAILTYLADAEDTQTREVRLAALCKKINLDQRSLDFWAQRFGVSRQAVHKTKQMLELSLMRAAGSLQEEEKDVTQYHDDRLEELEGVIHRGKNSFIEVGRALAEIRSSKLYAAKGFTSFGEYCDKVWGWTSGHARRQIRAAQVVEGVPDGTVLSEYSARSLSALPTPDLRSEAIEIAQSRASEEGRDIRHRDVRDAVATVAAQSGIVSAKPVVGLHFANKSISILAKIPQDDPERGKAVEAIEKWVNDNRSEVV